MIQCINLKGILLCIESFSFAVTKIRKKKLFVFLHRGQVVLLGWPIKFTWVKFGLWIGPGFGRPVSVVFAVSALE